MEVLLEGLPGLGVRRLVGDVRVLLVPEIQTLAMLKKEFLSRRIWTEVSALG